MSSRDRLDEYLSDSISAGAQEVDTLPTVPTDETWRLMRFGGGAVDKAAIALQANLGGTWTTIRLIAAPDGGEFTIDRDYTGNGTLRFRIVRQNKHSAAQDVVAWLEAYKRI